MPAKKKIEKEMLVTKALEILRRRVDMYDVASYLDIDSSTVKKWKEGKAFPNLVNMIQLSHFLGCRVEDLISEEKELFNQKRQIKGQMSIAEVYPDAVNN